MSHSNAEQNTTSLLCKVIKMGSLPKRFWPTVGFGIDSEHKLNAFDMALAFAGISEYNVRCVSSVPPTEMIEVEFKDGLTYVPMPQDAAVAANIRSKFPTVMMKFPDKEEQEHVILETSWNVDMIQARMEGDQFQTISASMGMIWYYHTDGNTQRVYAVEDHGLYDALGSLDQCYEKAANMLKMRGSWRPGGWQAVRDAEDDEWVKLIEEDTPVYTVTERGTGRAIEFYKVVDKRVPLYAADMDPKEDPVCYGRKIVWKSMFIKMEVHTATIERIPEGYVGSVISNLVMDPLTEVHA